MGGPVLPLPAAYTGTTFTTVVLRNGCEVTTEVRQILSSDDPQVLLNSLSADLIQREMVPYVKLKILRGENVQQIRCPDPLDLQGSTDIAKGVGSRRNRVDGLGMQPKSQPCALQA